MRRKRHPSRDSGGNFGRGGHWIRTEKRQRIYDRDGRRCVYCLAEERAVMVLTLDHVLPRAKGGNHAYNLVTACLMCNSAKGDRSAVEFCFEAFPFLQACAALDRVIHAMGTPLPEAKKRKEE